MKASLFSRMFKSRASPQNSYWGNTISFLFGITTSGKTVNEKTAMQTTAVYACVRILAETIASLPLHIYRHSENGKEKALQHRYLGKLRKTKFLIEKAKFRSL